MRQLKANPLQELRRILHDQYSIGSIIKELLQNADDAHAKYFHIGWTSKWPDGVHPLLTSPAIFILNDGKFEPHNERAIGNLDVGSKGTEQGAIGKFGLGMKSVFHLCEGFFFVASANQPASKGEPMTELVTPWPPLGPHASWANLDSARHLLWDTIGRWPHGCERWFCLVLPLRTREHHNGKPPIVPGQYPTVDGFREELENTKFCELAPLTRHLEQISIWDWNPVSNGLDRKSTLTLDFQERCTFPNLQQGPAKLISGRFTEQRGSDPELANIAIAVGLERHFVDARLHELRADKSRWPKNITIDLETCEEEDKDDKADLHSAVVFSAQTAKEGVLSIDHAVFLPLAQKVFSDQPCDGQHKFHVVLHGHFFLDGGRKQLLQADTRESLEGEWNRGMLDRGVLPMVLNALDTFVARSGSEIGGDAAHHLTSALSSSEFFKSYRQQICSEFNWIYHYQTTGSTWSLVHVKAEVFKIPEPCRPGLPSEVFPTLGTFAVKNVVTFTNSPSLCLYDTVDCWPDEPLGKLLGHISAKTLFEQPDRFPYLVEFLRVAVSSKPSQQVCIALSSLIANIVSAAEFRNLEDHEGALRTLVALLPASSRCIVPIELRVGLDRAVFAHLNSPGRPILLLPKRLDPDSSPSQGCLSVQQAGQLLTQLSELSAESVGKGDLDGLRATLSIAILKSVGEEDRQTLLTTCQDLGLFRVRVIGPNAQEVPNDCEFWSYRQLQESQSSHRLYRYSQGANEDEAKQSLCDALAACEIVTIAAELAGLILGQDSVATFGPGDCAEVLGRRPSLKACTRRARLLRYLLKNTSREELPLRRDAIRYLLHGSADHCDEPLPLLELGNNSDAASAQVAMQGLELTKGAWRIIDPILGAELSPAVKEILTVQPIDQRAAVAIMLEAGLDHFDWHTILDLLLELKELPIDITKGLASVAWLPSKAGHGRIRPCDVIHLKDLQKVVQRSLTAINSALKSVVDLHEDLRKHKGFEILEKEVFPASGEALLQLGRHLGKDSRFSVGMIDALTEDTLKEFNTVFEGCPDDLSLAYDLIKRVTDKVSLSLCATNLLRYLKTELSADQLVAVLNFLQKRHEERSQDRATVLKVHSWYLACVARMEVAQRRSVLLRIQLLSRLGTWKSPRLRWPGLSRPRNAFS